MPPVQSALLRRAVGVVCELLIAELNEILLHKKRQLLQGKTGRGKMKPDTHRKRSSRSAPQPITVVSVDGINMAVSESGHEVIVPDDPLANIQIKQEVEDIAFEEELENEIPTVKTEVKQEMFVDELMMQESSTSDGITVATSNMDSNIDGSILKSILKGEEHGSNMNDKVSDESYKIKEEASSMQNPLEITTLSSENMDKPYVCKFCYITFATFKELKKHAVNHKVNKRKHECTKCNQKFKKVSQLKIHLQSHAKPKKEDKSTDNVCKYCRRNFSDSEKLKKHKLLHIQANFNASERIWNKYTRYQRRSLLEYRRAILAKVYKFKRCPKAM